MGTVDVSPENVMPDRRRGRCGRSGGARDEIFVRKIIILLLLMDGRDALLAAAGGRVRNLRGGATHSRKKWRVVDEG